MSIKEDEFEDEDLEDNDYEEDSGLIALSSEELVKYLESFSLFFENPYDKPRRSLVMENTIEFLDNFRKIKTASYEGFKDLLLNISSKIDTAKQYCTGNDVALLDLLNDAENLIQTYLKDYQPEKYSKEYYKYPQQKYGKFGKYPYYKYGEVTKESDKISKEHGKKLAHYLKDRNNPRFDRDNPVEKELNNTIDNLDTKEEEPDIVDKIFLDALAQIKNKKVELDKRKAELQELSEKKISLSSKKEVLDNYRKIMLDKFISQLILQER
jgi:hypothetical protein